MTIYRGSRGLAEVMVGSRAISEIMVGSRIVWQAARWTFLDTFDDRTGGTMTTNGLWVGSGGWIRNGQAGKDGNSGQSRYWSSNMFSSDDMHIQARLGTLNDRAQVTGLRFGSETYGAQWVGLDISRNRTILNTWNGSTWATLDDAGDVGWEVGDVAELKREGSSLYGYRNGEQILSGVSTLARGTTYRRVGIEFNMTINFFIEWPSPYIDEVRALSK